MTVVTRNQSAIQAAKDRKLGGIREAHMRRANQMIGKLRENFVTSLPGQDMIYKAKEDEARLYLSLDPEPETLDGFPFLRAEIGILAPTAELVAQTWIGMGAYWREVAASLEGLRIGTKGALSAASSEAEMDQIMETFEQQLEALG